MPLLEVGTLGDEEAYVPPGWCAVGGDPKAIDGLPETRAWVEGFVLAKTPVTNAEYLVFLNALVDAGQGLLAERVCPKLTEGLGQEGAEVSAFLRTPSGHFVASEAVDGVWEPDWPVVLIDYLSATSYARWRADRDALPWRIPHEAEREKAARGVDGRFAPWGDHVDPSFTWCGSSAEGALHRRSVRDPRFDRSVYGVTGLAGNTADWCLNPWSAGGPVADDGRVPLTSADPERDTYVAVRGGTWAGGIAVCRSANRLALAPTQRRGVVGLRLCRSVGAPQSGTVVSL